MFNMAPKKNKGKKSTDAANAAMGPPPKPKKIPPPPACFTPDDLARYKEIFKTFDKNNIDLVKLEAIPLMLRTLGFNPTRTEINELFKLFLEDEFVDVVALHEWYFMLEAKINWGDTFETEIVKALAFLGHDVEETGTCDFEKLAEELMTWGDPLEEIEFTDWRKLATKDKTLNPDTGQFTYEKFVENMNSKDTRYFKEPINYFKLDQKTLAEMAIKKAQEEREEQERRETEARSKEETRRQKLIADGKIQA